MYDIAYPGRAERDTLVSVIFRAISLEASL